MKPKTLFCDGVDYTPYRVEDEQWEFVNLDIEDTGIEGIILCISKLNGLESHIIHFQDIKNKKEILVVSIPSGGIITDTSKIDVTTKQMVQQFVIQNAETLQEFWDNGADWYLRDLLNIMSNLNKIDASQFKISNQYIT